MWGSGGWVGAGRRREGNLVQVGRRVGKLELVGRRWRSWHMWGEGSSALASMFGSVGPTFSHSASGSWADLRTISKVGIKVIWGRDYFQQHLIVCRGAFAGGKLFCQKVISSLQESLILKFSTKTQSASLLWFHPTYLSHSVSLRVILIWFTNLLLDFGGIKGPRLAPAQLYVKPPVFLWLSRVTLYSCWDTPEHSLIASLAGA